MKFDLKAELLKYDPFDNFEKAKVKKVLDFLKNNNESWFERTNLSGHITAGGFVADREGNILLNHHKKSGMWFQFGGHSDGNPNSLEVAKREVFEESGIANVELISDKIFDVDVQPIPANETKGEPEHFHYDINFLFFVKDKNFEISNESVEIKWVTIEEARKLVHPLDTGIQRMIDKYEKLINIKKDSEKMENNKYGMAELMAEFGDQFDNYKELHHVPEDEENVEQAEVAEEKKEEVALDKQEEKKPAEPKDITLKCKKCENEFVWTVKDQEFYKSKGFFRPSYCKDCRKKMKVVNNFHKQ